jgi:hypothetical protein
MVHGVFALMNICLTLFSLLCASATAPVMSADGSWSAFTHEHLPDRCSLLCACYSTNHVSRWFMEVCRTSHLTAVLFALRFLQRQSCQQMVHGVCTHEHLDAVLFALRRASQSCQQMVHGVFALMNICQIVVLCSALASAISCQQMVHECLHS